MLTIMATEAVGGPGRHVSFERWSENYCLCVKHAFPDTLMAHHKQKHGLDKPMNWNVCIANDINKKSGLTTTYPTLTSRIASGINEESGLATSYPTLTSPKTPSASCGSYKPLSSTNEPDAGPQTYRDRAVNAVRNDPYSGSLDILFAYDIQHWS